MHPTHVDISSFLVFGGTRFLVHAQNMVYCVGAWGKIATSLGYTSVVRQVLGAESRLAEM